MKYFLYTCLKNMPNLAIKLLETNKSNPGHINDRNEDALYFAIQNI